jgi:hypothetical protein
LKLTCSLRGIMTNDPHNNIYRNCDVIGVRSEPRSWRVVEYFHDGRHGSSYWLVNLATGAKMRANLSAMTNLW